MRVNLPIVGVLRISPSMPCHEPSKGMSEESSPFGERGNGARSETFGNAVVAPNTTHTSAGMNEGMRTADSFLTMVFLLQLPFTDARCVEGDFQDSKGPCQYAAFCRRTRELLLSGWRSGDAQQELTQGLL